MLLVDYLSCTWRHIQSCLFPWLSEEVGPLTEAHRKLIATLEILRIEAFVRSWPGLPGRPPRDRAALARASHGVFPCQGLPYCIIRTLSD